jgi:hypothetical protein
VDRSVTCRRIQVGRQLRVIRETADEVELEGAMRLSPGRTIEIVVGPGETPPVVRPASVLSWSVVRLGKEGPMYRGACRWE